MYAEVWHTNIHTQNLKTMISQGEHVVQAGLSVLHKDMTGVQDRLEDIKHKMSESKSDREPCVRSIHPNDLFVKQVFRASITPLRRVSKSAADELNAHHQLEKMFWAQYFIGWDSSVQPRTMSASQSTTSHPLFRFCG